MSCEHPQAEEVYQSLIRQRSEMHAEDPILQEVVEAQIRMAKPGSLCRSCVCALFGYDNGRLRGVERRLPAKLAYTACTQGASPSQGGHCSFHMPRTSWEEPRGRQRRAPSQGTILFILSFFGVVREEIN